MIKRLLRGSSSKSSEDKKKEENRSPKYNLPRTVEVRPCEWPCNEFLEDTGNYEDFYYFANNEALTDFLHDQRE